METNLIRLGDCVLCNPTVKLTKGQLYSLIDIDKIEIGRKFVTKKSLVSYSGQSGCKFEDGDTLMARITPCLENGKMAVAKIEDKGIGSTELFVFRNREGVTDKEFVYYLFKQQYIRNLAANSMTGASGRQRADLKFVKRIKLNLPLLPIQHRIASILSTYDMLIENNTKRNRLLEKMAENLYKEWFVRFRFPGHEKVEMENGLPKGWKYVNFGKLSPIVTGKKDANFASPNGKYKFFTCSKADLMADSYSFDCFAIILAGNGDLNVKLYKGQFEAYQRTYVLTPYDISHIYISYYTIQSELDRLLVGAAGAVIKFLTKGMIEKIKIVVPDQSLLRKFNIMLDANFKIRQNLIAQNTLLARQRDLLLPRLMSGKLEV